MSVEAIFCDIEFAAHEPLGIRSAEVPLQHFFPGLAPLKCGCLFGPKSFGIGYAAGIFGMVLFEGFDLQCHSGNGKEGEEDIAPYPVPV